MEPGYFDKKASNVILVNLLVFKLAYFKDGNWFGAIEKCADDVSLPENFIDKQMKVFLPTNEKIFLLKWQAVVTLFVHNSEMSFLSVILFIASKNETYQTDGYKVAMNGTVSAETELQGVVLQIRTRLVTIEKLRVQNGHGK